MHEGGTSLISEILHKSGIIMGNDFKKEFRMKYEDIEGLILNNVMLYYNHDYLRFLKIRKGFDCFQDMIAKYIEKRSKDRDWGFKDPKTITNWDGWISTLKNYDYKIIAIYRNPISVARHLKSIKKENPELTLEYFLNFWGTHNQVLLDIVENSKVDNILLSYDELVSTGNLSKLNEFMGLELNNYIDKSKRHYQPEEIPEKYKELWNDLEKYKEKSQK